MDGFLLDVRSAWRAARRRPALTALTVVTLVLGIGANTAIFAVARGVLLRPLPYQDPDSLAMIWRNGATSTDPRGIGTPEMLREYRARNSAFIDLAAVELWRGNLSAQIDLVGADGAERLRGSLATPNFFSLLGVNAAMGRTFVESDEAAVVVLSDALWRRRYGADPAIVGKTIDLVGRRARTREPHQVIGVLPPRFRFTYPEDTEVWLPLSWPEVAGATSQSLLYHFVARLKPGIGIEAANADLLAVATSMHADLPKGGYDRMWLWIEPVHEWSVGRARPVVGLIGGVTLLVLVIASLNVTSLLLAQTASRRREFALQQALGASRGRLIRQLLTESALFTAFATTGAVVVVLGIQQLVRAILPPSMPRVDEIGVDAATVAWTTGVGAVTLLLAGLLPSWRGTRLDPNIELGVGGRFASGGRAAARLRQGLTMLQIGAASVLLIGGSLLLQSLWNLQRVDLGFDGTAVLTQEIRLLGPQYRDEARRTAFHDAVLQRVRGIAGVREASTTSAIPMRGTDYREALPVPGTTERVTANRRHVDPAYFDVMRIPLIEGRLLTAADGTGAGRVAVVSQSLARTMFPGGSAVGQHLPYRRLVTTGPPRMVNEPMEIVGVVGDVRALRVEDAGAPAFYVPRAQLSMDLICVVIRVEAGAEHVAAAVRAAIREVDPNQPVGSATTVAEVVAGTFADRRFYAIATMAFAGIALLLTVAGLYGVMVISAAERIRELGIRVALGATRRRLIALLLRQGLVPVLAGVALGALAAAWGVDLVTAYLFGVAQVGAPVYLVVTLLVAASGLLACLLPARHAASVDPITALRAE